MKLSYREIDSSSNYLQNVIELADKYSSTLGFLPRGAISRLADKKRIIACISIQMKKCVGYALFEPGKSKAKLVHLCVDEEFRGQGIAKTLVKEVKRKTEHLPGLLVSCRRDYNLETMWAALGFVAIHERPGRSSLGTTLTEWWMDYCHPNLLTYYQDIITQNKACVVIDSNIFYDLFDEENHDEYSQYSKALLADWISSEIEIFLTSEISNEINRNNDPVARKELRRFSDKFQKLNCAQDKCEELSIKIRKFFPKKMSKSDESDLRHLARALGSDTRVDFFVTRDTRLLEEVEKEVFEKYKLKIIHPVDLIVELDELRREIAYQPIRLAGTSISKRLVSSGNYEFIVKEFLNYSIGETKAAFRKEILRYLSNPDVYECFLVSKKETEAPLLFYVLERTDSNSLKIPLFRTKKDFLTFVICQHIVLDLIKVSVSEKRDFTKFSERYLSEEFRLYLRENHFCHFHAEWVKLNLSVCGTSSNVANAIQQACQPEENEVKEHYSYYLELLTNYICHESLAAASIVEDAIFPGKIIDSSIPNFIIPIQSWFAKDLFDAELAEGVLWGAKDFLALRKEMVYYRSKMASGGLSAPARILWYVSKGSSGNNSSAVLGAIRACSRLDEIAIDKPPSLHRKFKRLGVYDYPDLLRIAKGDSGKDIMAIKFSNTEVFKTPIVLSEVEKLIERKILLRAPYKINANSFESIYNTGVLAGN